MFATIEEIINDVKNGKIVIIIDDESRENEGDLVIAAEKVTPEIINFMAKYGRGLICMPISPIIQERLKLALMVQNNQSKFKTAFTISIGAREGITTGISAFDRAHTIQIAVNSNAKPDDIVSPGHIFPIVAKENGVIERDGHTEATVDLAKLAGLNPAAVLCEIMSDDGTMARLPELTEFAKTHNLKIGKIADLIEYRKNKNL